MVFTFCSPSSSSEQKTIKCLNLLFQSLELQQQKASDLMEMCLQKDDIISKLQAAMDATVDDATRDVTPVFNWHLPKWVLLSHSTDVLTESSGGGHQVGAPAAPGEMLLSEQESH